MPAANLENLLKIRSRLADDVVAFCDAAIARLDTTGFSFKRPDGESAPVTISTTVIDARVFTLERETEPRNDGPRGSTGAKAADNQPANAHEKALAELNENPWVTERRKTKPWSRAFAEARPGRPLVVRGPPGGGKTTLSRHSAIRRLQAVRDALEGHTLLVEETEPMLWTTCTALAECAEAADPADLVIGAAFHALHLPEDSPARSPRVRAWLREKIKSGQCPVAVDSLDEVSEKDRAAFQARAPRLLHVGSPVVLTCRVVEWEQRRGWTGWGGCEVGPFELAPLDRKEQRTYMTRFFREGIAMPAKLDGIRCALDANMPLGRTCESPILLFFACLLHAEGELAGAVRRTDFYQRIRRQLFLGEWKGLPNPPTWADGKIHEARVTDWIGEIAFALFRNKPEGKTFSVKAWEQAVENTEALRAEQHAYAVELDKLPDAKKDLFLKARAEDLFADLERCGFVVYAGWSDDQPHYSLPHRSFLAYMTGRALAARPRALWLKEAVDHLWFQPAWEDVILFLAGHLGEAEADALLDEIEKQPEDIFRQRLRWQWRVAGETKTIPARWGELWTEAAFKLAQGERGFSPSGDAADDLLQSLAAAARVAPHPLDALLQSLELAREPSSDVRWRAAAALGQIGTERALDALLQSLDFTREPDVNVRRRAALAIGNISSERALKVLIRSLEPKCEPNSDVRIIIVNTLGAVGVERAFDALSERLDYTREPDSRMRGSVAASVGEIGGEHAPGVLIPRLAVSGEPHASVRGKVAYALGKVGGTRALEALLRHLDSEADGDVRSSILVALGNIGGERALEALLPRVDPDREAGSNLRAAAAVGLVVIGGVRALEALIHSLDHPREFSGYARAQIAFALGRIGGGRALEALVTRLNSTNESHPEARAAIGHALGQIGGERALSAVLTWLEPDGTRYVSARIPSILGRFDNPRALSALLKRLERGLGSDSEARSIVNAIGQHGGKLALDALLPRLDSGAEHERYALPWVADALFKIYWRLGERRPFLTK